MLLHQATAPHLRREGIDLAPSELTRRGTIADHASKTILPVARREEGFAGLYQDQDHGGRIVVRFTKASAGGRARVLAAAATDAVLVTEGARWTFGELVSAVDRALQELPVAFKGITIYGAGVNEVANVVDIGVDQMDIAEATALADKFASRLGVGVNVVVAEPATEQAQVCDGSGRSTCHDPMRAGTLVHNASWDGTTCTMGFHVQLRSNSAQKGFLLSGHCSFPGGSTSWYMDSWAGPASNGFIGAVWTPSGNLYKDLGQDAMVVAMPSNQVSRQIYDTTRAVAGSGNPVTGETIYISPGKTDELNNSGIDTGTVAHGTWSYLSGDSFIIHGADADGFSTRDGDSGSPIYRAVAGGAVAVGIHDTAQGYFARMQDVLNALGWSVY